MKLIVGLGNPGEKYAGNRHNIGFLAVNEIARGYAFGPWKRRFQGHAAEGQIGIQKCILLKPGTYMNESGRSVGEAMRFYKLPIGDVIVVHDELDLKPGAIRVKTGGGNAGHNGLKSVSAHIGNEYTRVRLGIGHPGDKTLVSNYVLQDFAKSDRDWLEPLLEGVARGMARLVEGSEAAFLSEAARGRSKSAPAAKPDGAPIIAPASVAAPDVEAGTLALIAAASSRVIQPMSVPPIHVAAARESGGGAVSTAAMMPELKSGPDAAAIKEASRALNPVPAAMVEREPAVDETPPLSATAQIEWGSSGPAPAETVSPVPKGAASKAPAAPEQRKKGGLFSSLFRPRSRGGVKD